MSQHALFRVAFCYGFFLVSSTAIAAGLPPVSQIPLQIGGSPVDNLVLTPSVEFPTVVDVANIDPVYSTSKLFAGYFDSDKCYTYVYDGVNSYFDPVSISVGHVCSGLWSGNYLNWASTQTIDSFRSVLTGGDRFIDKPDFTVLQKARNFRPPGTASFPDRSIPSSVVTASTPLPPGGLNSRIGSQYADPQTSNPMLDRRMLVAYGAFPTVEYSPYVEDYKQGMVIDKSKAYRLYVRVRVCKSSGLLEENCRKYGNNYKPEGLLQQYSDRLRVSVFSYLIDKFPNFSGNNILWDGGVLRARQKSVGPLLENGQNNQGAEWSSITGVFTINPSPADASDTLNVAATQPTRSGVINYINKFGENGAKTYDNVSELYYAALRYLKHQGNVPEWTASPTSAQIDNFPVVTTWDDPIKYSCQKNVILGIGDVYTHADKNLPGGVPSAYYEPAMPALVSGDSTVNVETATKRVATIEGISNPPDHNSGGSSYIAGLAYDAHVKDIRPDLPGMQTVSTYWVDVQENSVLTDHTRNQYYLAAKFGGFVVPTGANLGDPYTRTTPLPTSWWHTNSDVLSTGDLRPDNFFTGGDPLTMRDSLRRAFAQIASASELGAGNLVLESKRVQVGSRVFRPRVTPRRWSGDLVMSGLASNGTGYSYSEAWRAASKLDGLSDADIVSRKIFTIKPAAASTSGPSIASQGRAFNWSQLDSSQQAALAATSSDPQKLLDYLRGSRADEQTSGNTSALFRQRNSRLGDIINSAPVFSGSDPQNYANLPAPMGPAYPAFVNSSVYQNRVPLVAVGANDGMLHGFDASFSGSGAGQELFAYVPNAVFDHLGQLGDPAYTHRYYVDGSPTASDAWDGSNWRTLLVGSTGAGGKSVFALDVTDPSNMSKSSVLWEFSHSDMGYTLAKPVLAALPSGKFAVIVTSGAQDTPTAKGYVWLLDAMSGAVLNTIELPGAGDLLGVTSVSTSGSAAINRLYVSDSKGALWRIDWTGAGGWAIPSSLNNGPLFKASLGGGDSQPITAPVRVVFDKKGRLNVVFGTGAYYRIGDNELPAAPQQPQRQSVYSIIDSGTLISGRNSLQQAAPGQTSASPPAPLANAQGWYLDLPNDGSRIILKGVAVTTDRVDFDVLTPKSDPCEQDSATITPLDVDPITGKQLNYGLIDTDGDGRADALSAPGGTTTHTIARDNGAVVGGGGGGNPNQPSAMCDEGGCVSENLKDTSGRKAWQELR